MAKTARVHIPTLDEYSARTKKKTPEAHVNRPLEERGREAGVQITTTALIHELQEATAELETTKSPSGRARIEQTIAAAEADLAGRDLTSHINTMHLELLDAQAARAATSHELVLAEAREANDQEIASIEQKYADIDAKYRTTEKTAKRLARLQHSLDSQLESGVRLSDPSREPPINLPVAPEEPMAQRSEALVDDGAAPIPLEVRKIADADLVPVITPKKQRQTPPSRPPGTRHAIPPPPPLETVHETSDADDIEVTVTEPVTLPKSVQEVPPHTEPTVAPTETTPSPNFDDLLQEKVDAFLLLDAEGRKAMIDQARKASKDGAAYEGFRDWTQEQVATLAAKLEAIQSVPEATQDLSETYRPKREQLAYEHERSLVDRHRNRLTAQITRAASAHGGEESILRIHDNSTWKTYAAADFARRYLELLERDAAYIEARQHLTGFERAKRVFSGFFGKRAPEDEIMTPDERREFKQMDDVVEELAIEKSTYRTAVPAMREHT